MIRFLPEILASNSLQSRDANRASLSVSRTPNHIYAIQGFKRDALLILDAGRLKHKYKLHPIYGDIMKPRTDIDKERWERLGVFRADNPWTPDLTEIMRRHGREAEERIYQPVKPLNLYLREIILSKSLLSVDRYPWKEINSYCCNHDITVSMADMTYHRSWIHRRISINIPFSHVSLGDDFSFSGS